MQREQINTLITHLIAIKEFSRDIHYTAHGEAFYAKHIFVDKFDFDNNIDLLKECVLLGNDERPLSSKNYLERANTLIPEIAEKNDKQNFIKLYDLINSTLMNISLTEGLNRADENVIGSIAQDLQQYKGLINLQIEE